MDYEPINLDDIKTEKILLGFRCSNGVELSLFTQKELEKVKDLIDNDKVLVKDERIYNKNFLLSDELALYILD